jgi:hypothetical protein
MKNYELQIDRPPPRDHERKGRYAFQAEDDEAAIKYASANFHDEIHASDLAQIFPEDGPPITLRVRRQAQ